MFTFAKALVAYILGVQVQVLSPVDVLRPRIHIQGRVGGLRVVSSDGRQLQTKVYSLLGTDSM